MFLLQQVLPAVAVAAVAAAIISWLALRGRSTPASLTVAGCGLGAGYLAGHLFITGWTRFPPPDTTNWLPYFAILAGAIGSLISLLNSKVLRIALSGVVCLCAMRLLLAPKFQYGWSAGEGWLWVGCLGCAAFVLHLHIAGMSRRSSTLMEVPLLMIVVSAGIGGALMLSGSLLLGQFAAVLAAAVVGNLVLMSRIDRNATALAFSLVAMALIACGYFFSGLPDVSAVLLAAAPFATLIPVGFSAPRWAGGARTALVAAVVGGAIFVAWQSSPS